MEEVCERIIIPAGSAHNADALIEGNFILLVEREMSKVELLKRECFFINTVWIVNFDKLKSARYSEQANEFFNNIIIKYKSHKEYVIFYKTKIIRVQESIIIEEKKRERNKDTSKELENKKAIDSYTKKLKIINTHIQDFRKGVLDFQKLFEEDWTNCTPFPFQEDGVKRFKYISSPLFLDMGGFLFYRKFIPSSFLYSQSVSYLKCISYSEFLDWLKDPKTEI